MNTAIKLEINFTRYKEYYCASEKHKMKYLGIDGTCFIFCPFCGAYFIETKTCSTHNKVVKK